MQGAALDAMPILRRGFFIMGVIVVFLVLFCRNWLSYEHEIGVLQVLQSI